MLGYMYRAAASRRTVCIAKNIEKTPSYLSAADRYLTGYISINPRAYTFSVVQAYVLTGYIAIDSQGNPYQTSPESDPQRLGRC